MQGIFAVAAKMPEVPPDFKGLRRGVDKLITIFAQFYNNITINLPLSGRLTADCIIY